MNKYKTTVEAIQLTTTTFDGEHPSENHVLGVLYDPQQRCAFIQSVGGMTRLEIGDWIVRDIRGQLYAVKDDLFRASHARDEAR